VAFYLMFRHVRPPEEEKNSNTVPSPLSFPATRGRTKEGD